MQKGIRDEFFCLLFFSLRNVENCDRPVFTDDLSKIVHQRKVRTHVRHQNGGNDQRSAKFELRLIEAGQDVRSIRPQAVRDDG